MMKRKLTMGLCVASLLAIACGGGNQLGAPAGASGPTITTTTGETIPRYDTLLVHVMRDTADGKSTEIGKLERPLTDFRDQAVSLLVRKSKQAGEVADGAPAEYEARIEIGKEKIALPTFKLDCSKPEACIAKEWLDLELKAPGAPSRHVKRALFAKDDDNTEPPGFRRHTITAVPDAIARDEVLARVTKALGGESVDARKAKADAIKAEAEKAKPEQQAALLARLDDLDANAAMGHLIALAHAAESDKMTDDLAASIGVTVRRLPRILIVTAKAQNDGGQVAVSLDLRLDEVATTSSDLGAARLFQQARGMQESEIEAAVMKSFFDKDTVASTALLMKEAMKNSVGVVHVTQSNRADLEPLSLPPAFAKLVNAKLDKGHAVILPKQAVNLAGRARWGFWDIEPATGATIGIMEGGERQAIVEGPLINKSVAQNPALGYCLGFMEGVITFQWGLMGGLLKYGGLTPDLIAELKAELEQIACSNPCNFKIEAKVEVNVTECKMELAKASKSPVPKDWDYCKEYKKGFECAVGVLLAGLTDPGKDPRLGGKGKAVFEFACIKIGPEVK